MNNLAFQIYGSTKSGIFQSTWKTDNAGVSSSTQIELPLLSGGTYNFWIDWGDGSTTNVTSYSQRTHTYASAGTYTLRATGTINGWGFQNSGDKLKILTISSWGKLKLGAGSFQGCSNVTMSGITDVPDLSAVTSLGAAFAGCSKITTVGRMNEWDTSLITSMSNMFVACVLFNQPLNNWNTGNVTGFVNMFNSCFLFNQCLGSWNVTKCTSFEGMFYSCLEFNNGDNSVPLNNWTLNTTSPVNLQYPFIDCRKFNRYIGDWNTSKVNSMADLFNGCTIFNNGFAPGVGTGNQLNWDTSSCTNMSKVFYQAPAFNSNLGTGTTPWDVSKVTTFASMFNGATNFNNGDDAAPINNWNINTVSNVSMNSMFMGASIFNRDISNWNMTKVNHIGFMFNTATAFNQPVGNWERTGSTLGNVTNMRQTFRFTNFFNQDISNWNVNKVTDFGFMFNAAIAFNNGSNSNTNPVTSRTGIDGWDINTVSNVTMDSMFQSANFNRYIGDWNVSKVTTMGNMFLSNTSFNQDLSKWNMSSVTSMESMFYSASAFTNGSNTNTNPVTGLTGINGWNINTTAASVNMGGMFANAYSFNQPIDSWNVSKVYNMNGMFFYDSAFNQPIGSWDVSKVTNMAYMFVGTVFNQPISSWDVSKVNTMENMFQSSAFNQNIGNWNVSQVTNFTNFMLYKTPATFSSTNLDAIYNGWIVNGVKPNINISFGTAKYTAAGAIGRATLAAPPNGTGTWTITDGGQI